MWYHIPLTRFMAALYVKALTGLLIVFLLSGIHLISSEEFVADLLITTPKTMEALSGSCIQIPCNFSTRDTQVRFIGDTFGVWMKTFHQFSMHPESVIFNSSKTVNTYQGEIPGDLRQRNCTTIFYNVTTDHAAVYYFRVENDAFKANAVPNDPFEMTVIDDPPSPNTTHNISSEQKEGDIATFTCSAITPCPAYPPVLRWNPSRDNDTQTRLEENTDRTITARSQMTLTLAEEHDGVIVSCSVQYPVNGTESDFKMTNKTLLRLDVKYSPKRTSASVSPAGGVVSVGSWVNMTCTSTAKPRVHSFIWFKTSKDGPTTTNVSVGYLYSFNVSSADDGGAYYCEATNALGTQRSPEIRIHLPIEGSEDPSVSSLAIIGVLTVVTLMIFLVVFIWWLHSRRSVVQQTQRQLVGVPAGQNVDEDIHYGEIDFSKMQSNRGSGSRVTEPEPNTEYAEVKAGQRRAHTSSNVTETANEPNDDLYAQVKNH